MVKNILRCSGCGLSIIQEESHTHECRKIQPQRFFFDTDDDYVSIYDGFRWIRINSDHQPTGNTSKTTEDETEPEMIKFLS